MTQKLQRARRREAEYADYDLEIETWSWGYNFGLSFDKHSIDPYWEAAHIEVLGRVLSKPGLKYPAARVVIMPDPLKDHSARQVQGTDPPKQPRGVGSISVVGKKLEVLVSVPQQALAPLVAAFSADRVKFMLLHGEALFRGRAPITSLSFETSVNEDDVLWAVPPKVHKPELSRIPR